MPGKPHSPLPCQQKPYIKQKVHGHYVDKEGNIVSGEISESHIPVEEFNYIKEIKKS